MHKYFQIVVAGMLLAFASQSVTAGVCADDRDLDSCLSSSDAVASCKQAVGRNSSDVYARLALCEAYVRSSELDSAQAALQRGLALCSGRRCSILKLAESNVRELKQREDRKVAEAKAGTGSRDRAYCIGPIANTRSIDACRRLLSMNKGEVAIAEVLAEKLLKTDQPTQALLALQNISDTSRTALGKSVATKAAKARGNLMDNGCFKGKSLAVCDAVLLRGGSFEDQIQRTRGAILSATGRPTEALKALQSSAALKPSNRKTAEAIVALQPVDFGSANAAYFESLAAAERILGNESGELAALRKLNGLSGNNLTRSMQAALARLKDLELNDQVQESVQQPSVAKVEPKRSVPIPMAKTLVAPVANPSVRRMETKPIQPESKVLTPSAGTQIVQTKPARQQQASESKAPGPSPDTSVAAVVYANSLDSAGRSH